MAFTVHVENFQSLADVTVEVKGFTVITGTNNSGKTALMRAIRGAFQNTRGTSYIRYGTTKAVVEITFDDGRKLRWEKGKAAGDKPTYIVDDGKPIYPGQAVPDEVRALGVKPIMVAGREVWPQFAPQFSGQIFLLDQPGSVLAEAVSDVAHVSQLNEALRLAESDKRAANSELRVRLADLVGLEAAVKRFDGLDSAETEVLAIEESHVKVMRVGGIIQAITLLRGQMETARDAVDALDGVEAVSVPTDDTIEVARAAADAVGVAEELGERLSKAQKAVGGLHAVQGVEVPDDDDIKDVRAILDAMDAIKELQSRMATANAAVTRLGGIPDFGGMDDDDADDLLGDLIRVEGLRDSWGKAIAAVSSIEGDIDAIDTTYEEVTSGIDEILGGLGECPVCGSPHAQGGGHL